VQMGLLDKAKQLLSKLVEPHPSIQDMRKRQQSRLLSSLLLLAIPIFAFSQFTSELVIFGTPIFLGGIVLAFVMYLGTKTSYYDVVLTISLAAITVLPMMAFLFGANWQPNDLPRLTIWVFVALLAGMLLSRTIVVLVQGITMVVLMTFIITVILGIPLSEVDSHIGTAVIVTFFVLIASYTLEQNIRQVDQRTADISRKQRELEVYMQLLRHDLRNDLQAILGLIELAELFEDLDAEKVKESLDQSLSLGRRMAQLLHVFSMPPEQPGTDVVKNIEEAAEESKKAHPNLKIEVSSGNDVSRATFTASRLLPMVWQNIFRNAAQYAGDAPTVHVDVALEGDVFVINISDNGPGMSKDKREFLFRRGSKVEPGEGGMGMYLSKVVLESHGGSIKLVDDESGGTRYLIRIPTSSS
jgi:signal transduction histidine kinase